MKVPFFSFEYVNQIMQAELDEALQRVVKSGRYIGGEEVAYFEKEWSRYLDIPYCVGCANGTDAIEIALRVFELGIDDEVIIPANTCLPAAEAVKLAGAAPVFCDLDRTSHNITAYTINQVLSPKTKAVLLTHLYGLPCDMKEIQLLLNKRDIKLIEDCSHAHGAEYYNQKVGSFGDIAIFSFYPTKNLGAIGDAGAIVTNQKEVADKVRLITNHGQRARNDHIVLGRNSRLDPLQAAVLRIRRSYLDELNHLRQENAAFYLNFINNEQIILPHAPTYSRHVYHQFVIEVKNNKRNQLIEHLNSHGIDTDIHYPYVIPFTEIFKEDHGTKFFPQAQYLHESKLSLPVFPGLTEEQLSHVVDTINKFTSS